MPFPLLLFSSSLVLFLFVNSPCHQVIRSGAGYSAITRIYTVGRNLLRHLALLSFPVPSETTRPTCTMGDCRWRWSRSGGIQLRVCRDWGASFAYTRTVVTRRVQMASRREVMSVLICIVIPPSPRDCEYYTLPPVGLALGSVYAGQSSPFSFPLSCPPYLTRTLALAPASPPSFPQFIELRNFFANSYFHQTSRIMHHSQQSSHPPSSPPTSHALAPHLYPPLIDVILHSGSSYPERSPSPVCNTYICGMMAVE